MAGPFRSSAVSRTSFPWPVSDGGCSYRYDVREKGEVRNHGKPVALAERYYQDGADVAW